MLNLRRPGERCGSGFVGFCDLIAMPGNWLPLSGAPRNAEGFIDRSRNEQARFCGRIRLGVQREGDFGCSKPLWLSRTIAVLCGVADGLAGRGWGSRRGHYRLAQLWK